MDSRISAQLLASAVLVRESMDLCDASAKSIRLGHEAIELSQEQLRRSEECLARLQGSAPGAPPAGDS